jgi:hypothetical protein
VIRRGLPFYSLASAISAPASAVEEGVNAVDSAFVNEYGDERGLPRNTGLIEAIRYLRGLFCSVDVVGRFHKLINPHFGYRGCSALRAACASRASTALWEVT